MDNKFLPKISIVTPAYNQGQFIEETILSVLNQAYPNIEYIIVDGGSTDNTMEVVKKYEKNLKCWISEPDNGQSDAINKGLKQCTGEIFNWLNSDDLLLPGSLMKIAKAFMEHKCDIVSGEEIIFYENGIEIPKKGSLIYPTLEETIYHGIIYQPSTYWDMNTFKSLAPVNINLHYLMDADLWIRYLLKFGQGKIVKVEDPIIKFRMHSTSKTMSQNQSFMEQRWFLRGQLAKHVDQLPAEWIELTNQLAVSVKDYPPLEIKQNLNNDKLRELWGMDLLELTYIRFDYELSRKILRYLIQTLNIKNKRTSLYWIKLMLIPDIVLNAFRKK